jgi:lipoprotein-releasing system ATP-binding protein
MNKVIEISDLNKIYGYGRSELRVLTDVNLVINKGEILSIMGPSGAGKSTLLNLIGCLDSFQGGILKIKDQDISSFGVEDLAGFRNKHLGFIFQLHNLLPEFTAVENVMIPLLIRREKKSQAHEKAAEILKRFGLAERLQHKPSELSGGECQRIAVARALVTEPDIILADEPTGSLDSNNSKMLTDILFEFGEEFKTTIVIVTHDKDIAALTERTITLVDGRIVDDKANIV